ncbi:glycosyltransferase family 2 protein [Halalkalibacter alkalisediminis]|uniref:Galactosyltransferase-related protein n=1 Tax=Halalkalibacter alkalisediminis TaxID=935616 RepID=A0ABV6NGL3_9BACI|nr:glycosyltransferase family 2 protein [Halalkalibacter alkalisediminis]
MLKNVSIIIPFQTDHGPRAAAFEWVKNYYSNVIPEAEVGLGIMNESHMNKAKAVNQAVKQATRDILVIADADVVYDPKIIVESIKLLKKAAWVVPFTELYDVSQEDTKKLLTEKPKWPIGLKPKNCHKIKWLYEGFAGKLIIIPRKHFEAVGGFDERFIGWGGEDDAFSHAVNTICGEFVNLKAKIFHLWHPPAYWTTNPNADANSKLLNRYIAASGNKKEMNKLIQERGTSLKGIEPTNQKGITPIEEQRIHSTRKKTSLDDLFNFSTDHNNHLKEMLNLIKERNQVRSKSNKRNEPNHLNTNLPKGKICFALLVHKDRDLIKQLIDNVRYYCPNSAIVLYNGGDDPNLCKGLGVPVCPSSRKLERGYTTIYFLETMEWIEQMGMDYDYFINVDSDALFFRKGYEEFLHEQMNETDYMAVKLRIPEDDWYIGNELKKDIKRWRKLFSVTPFYGVFNVGQVITRPLVKALLNPARKEKYKKALLETSSFGSDEIFFVNVAKELGFRIKAYPNATDSTMIRYRPYFTLEEMIKCLNDSNGWLCHPIHLDGNDPVRRFINSLESEHYMQPYKAPEFPWYENNSTNYSLSLPIKSSFGNLETIVRSGSSLTHYWQQTPNQRWTKSETFATGATGVPVFYENSAGQFEVVSKLKKGGIGLWWRDNHSIGHPWNGPYVILKKNVEPILLTQQKGGQHVLICKSGDKIISLMNSKMAWPSSRE